MSRRWSLVSAIFLLIWLITTGCGESERSVAGRYQLLSRPEYYIDLKSNGEFIIGSSGASQTGWDKPMSVIAYPQEGTWRQENGSTIFLRSSGMERPFGEPRGDEITDPLGAVWQRL